MGNLLIIESGGKKETLKKILGAGWEIQASGGHVTQLAKDGPGNLGFVIKGQTIDCHYEWNGERGKSAVERIKTAVKRADKVYLATDPDREGEAISWHLAQTLGLRNPQRITFTEITQEAVQRALAHPRKIDENKVKAQQGRQCLDRLVGFKLSPLLQQTIQAPSAGRVQSAALHILCAREREIQEFKPQTYWNVWVDYLEGEQSWRAYFKQDAQERIASEDEPDDTTEVKLSQTSESTRVLSQEEAERLVRLARSQSHQVMQVEGKITPKAPPPPLITSSLQQVAGAKLGYKPERTMEIAEKLYQGVDLGDGPKGLITYMRTDSVSLASEFVEATRAWLEQHDPKNLPPRKGTAHRNKAGTQGAHEAIRPCDVNLTPKQLQSRLTEEQHAVYSLIWRRAVASLVASARLRKTRILTRSGDVTWEARGMAIEFAGYTRYWDDLAQELSLPAVRQGQALLLHNAAWEKKQTQPPSRYTEPKLVQQMDRKGIGRPSTYAVAGKTLLERGYVSLKGKVLVPTELGLQADSLLAEYFPGLVDAEFTAQMESTLDRISEGKEAWERWLIHWNETYLDPALARAKQQVVALPRKSRSSEVPAELSRVRCSSCTKPMAKIPSQKMKKKYFLKCEACDLVLFWNDFKREWQKPRPRTEDTSNPNPQPASLKTEYPCPVCKKVMLEEYHYINAEGEKKTMLRCSDPEKRKNPKHKGVAFFLSKGVWWSKEYGQL
jgi:DNA topoisomerase-1